MAHDHVHLKDAVITMLSSNNRLHQVPQQLVQHDS
jgi:hypothetical protein